jgi:hypothetical protein
MRMRSWPAAVVLVLLAALVLPVTPTAAQPAGCGASPPGNGTGYVPPRNPG